MQRIIWSCIFSTAIFFPNFYFTQKSLPGENRKMEENYRSSICVKVPVKNKDGSISYTYGSGSIVVRNKQSFVLTAAHVVDSQREGENKFKPVQVLKYIIQKDLSKKSYYYCIADIVKFDPVTDIAILKPRASILFSNSITMTNDKPYLGRRLYTISSPAGQKNYNTMSFGRVVNLQVLDLVHKRTLMDQSDCSLYFGSSGGALFDEKTGDYVGMMLQVNFNFKANPFLPVRGMRKWSKGTGYEFIFNNTIPMPKDLSSFPIETEASVNHYKKKKQSLEMFLKSRENIPPLIKPKKEDPKDDMFIPKDFLEEILKDLKKGK